MSLFPDEMLMAYADGELAPEECRRLEAALATNPALRMRLEPFRLTGATLASVFDQPMREPVPPRLLAVVAAGPKAAAGAAQGRAPRMPASQGRPGLLESIADVLFPRGLQFASAFGIAGLLIAGGAAGWLMARSSGPSATDTLALEEGGVIASPAMLAALEVSPSRTRQDIGDGSQWVMPVLTFVDRDQRFCRQYEMQGITNRRFVGLACRQDDATWRVAFHAELKGAPSQSEDGKYGTAGATITPDGAIDPVNKALDSAVDSMKSGDALSADDEIALISKGWSTESN